MNPRARLALRGTALASCAALVAAGLVLAIRDPGSQPSEGERPGQDVVFVPAAATPPAVSELPDSARPTAGEPPAPPTQETTVEAATVVEVGTPLAPPPTVARPAVAPAAPPSPTATTAAPIQDLPKYKDLQVLGFAADAVLPSGLTFRQCMDLPPKLEGWPFAVHLYYLGRGDWMVETHLSEVQVVFHEATNSFEVRNFQPVNPGCRGS